MPPRRVLIVDDEPKIRQLVGAYFRADGFDTLEAATGTDALERFRLEEPDVVILDVMLPDLDGFEVLRRMRATSDAFVIMLTARADEADTLVGLAVGADDYVTKPFSPRELVARAKTVMRRGRDPDPDRAAGEIIDPGDLRIDLARHEVTRGGRVIDLSALAFDLLVALARSPGRVFTRRQLLERVWGWDFFGDERVVDVHIRDLRRALGDDATDPELIGTVRGVGYKLLEPSG